MHNHFRSALGAGALISLLSSVDFPGAAEFSLRAASAPEAAPELKEKLAALTKKVEEADAKVRGAAKSKKLHFELVPAT